MSRIKFLGIDPPEKVVKREILDAGELKRGYGAFEDDLYGSGEVLQGKRIVRGGTTNGNYDIWGMSQDPEVLNLLSWIGGSSGKEIFPGQLPWNTGDE